MSKKASRTRTRKARKALAPAPKKAEPKPVAPASKVMEMRHDWSLGGVLLATAALVRLFGFRRTSEGENSTKALVMSAIRTGFPYEQCDLQAVETARDWYRAEILESDDDFAVKLRAACERARDEGGVRDRDLGFVVSMVPCAQRWKERQKQASEEVVFAGIAGASGRQDLGPVTVEQVREMRRFDSWLVKARIQEGPFCGARVSWFSKKELEVGFQGNLRAKVRKHSEHYGETQVSLVRLS